MFLSYKVTKNLWNNLKKTGEMTLNDLISESLRCQMMTSLKIGKRKEKWI